MRDQRPPSCQLMPVREAARDRTDEARWSGGRPGNRARRPPPGPASSPCVARGARRLAAGLLLAAAGLLGASGAAEAQTTYVSNLLQTSEGVSATRLAQRFTTGSEAGGYALGSVDVSMSDINAGVTLSATIYETDASGLPTTTVVHALTAPSTFPSNSVLTFTAPASAMLDPSTTYIVVFQATSSIDFQRTSSDSEDEAETGWSIANVYTRHDGTRWRHHSSQSLLIAVKGPATTSTVPDAPTDLMATASGTGTINLEWTAPTNNGGSAITGYKIEVSADGGSTWTDLVANTNSTATTYAHTGLAASTTRHYRVSAINANGTGVASEHRHPPPRVADAGSNTLVSNLGKVSPATLIHPTLA